MRSELTQGEGTEKLMPFALSLGRGGGGGILLLLVLPDEAKRGLIFAHFSVVSVERSFHEFQDVLQMITRC